MMWAQEHTCGAHEEHQPMRDIVQRDTILLYDVEFTKEMRITG